jgi:hypothetical protein
VHQQQGRHECTSSKGQAQGADTSGEMGSMRVSNSPCSLTLLQMYHHKREEHKAGRDAKNTGERTCLVHVRLGARQAGTFIGPLIDTCGGARGGARSPLCRNKRAQPKPQPPQRRATMQWCGDRHQPREDQSAPTPWKRARQRDRYKMQQVRVRRTNQVCEGVAHLWHWQPRVLRSASTGTSRSCPGPPRSWW